MKKIIITTLLTACIFTTNANDLDTHVQCITIESDGSGKNSIESDGSGKKSIESDGSGKKSIESDGSGKRSIESDSSEILKFCTIIKI